jgi:hypothetical protein
MKTKALLLALLISLLSQAQTATNWKVNDCSGTNRELFTELDAGKVAVMIWVMPCAVCINPALSAQTEVQGANAQFPGKVVYYLIDDNGGTNCSTLESWASTNGITDATVISNSLVSMYAYGGYGMPKVVVVGGGAHKVYYSKNGPGIVASEIKSAIASALADPSAIKKNTGSENSLYVFPNPANASAVISFNTAQSSKIQVTLTNELGQLLTEIFSGTVNPGSNEFNFRTADLASGIYFVSVSGEGIKLKEKLIVTH